MGHKQPKQIVYRYNGDPKSEEVERDLDGEIHIPQRDEIVMRKGESWKVVQVNEERTVTTPRALPVFRIFLAAQSPPGAPS